MLALGLAAGSARADSGDEDQRKREGSALFEQAQALLKQGKLDEACVKFKEAYDRDRHAVGTVLNIAKCQARQGKIASAVATWKDARDLAKAVDFKEAIEMADTELAKLEPFVPHVTLSLAEADVEVFVDGQKVEIAAGGDLAIDPGRHAIEVRGKEREPRTIEVRVEKSEKKTVTVEKLRPVRPAKSTTLGIGVTAGGAAVLGAGVVIGFIAKGQFADARDDKAHCDGQDHPTCDAIGAKKIADAQSLGNVGTIIGVAGAVVAVGGAYLWWSASKTHHHHVVVMPDAGPEHAGVMAVGRF